MDIGSLLVGLALAIVAAAFVALPLLDHQEQGVTAEDRHLSELEAERDRVLTSLQELEMDNAMSKINDADYQDQRKALMAQGAGVLRAIDALHRGNEMIVDVELDAEIEAAVARMRSSEDDPEVQYCPSCGERVQEGDLFCTHCGASLRSMEQGA